MVICYSGRWGHIPIAHLADSVGAYFAVSVVRLARLEHRHVLTDIIEPLRLCGPWPSNMSVCGHAR